MRVWVICGLLIRFNLFFTYRQTIIRKALFPNFYNIFHRLIDIFDKKFAIGTLVHIFNIWGLE